MIGLICSLIVVGLDQLSKYLIYGTTARSIIGNLLWFKSTFNTGVAFSMFEGKGYIFVVVASVATIIMIYFIFSKKYLKSRLEKFSLGLVLGGTIGNVVDRILFKGVRDFIYLKFMNFAIFNIADMAICIGVALLALAVIIMEIKKDKKITDKKEI